MSIPDQTPPDGYQSPSVRLSRGSDLSPPDAEALIGRTIIALVGAEHGLALALNDGSILDIAGHTYTGLALDVTLMPPDTEPAPEPETAAPTSILTRPLLPRVNEPDREERPW